ncbi:uncharacterized protein LOC123528208 [Mercenaria mercenaria]|uniref:uncharacterized protein LOC123528208 n=1 Tax=Mercenaria mercenaria TaxID=6596 RepID=UPI00234EBD33|nr:uncharacterized protein LOC123528208 [Mercenaria mercenaria]
MNLHIKFSTALLMITVATVYSRVPLPPNSFQAFRRQAIIQHQPIIHHQTIIQHPSVLTRSQAQTSTQGQTNRSSKKTNGTTTATTATTTTTTEPPEVDDDFLPPQQRSRTRPTYINYDYYYNYNDAPTTNGYDYFGLGFGFNGAVVSGGVSREVDYDYNPPATQPPHRTQNPRPTQATKSTSTTTTATTTKSQTTTAETPEPDDDMITNPATVKSGAPIQETYTGYCFCSPLKYCPVDSIPRGGLCHNFLAYFTNLRFIRCCYSPSVARSLQL